MSTILELQYKKSALLEEEKALWGKGTPMHMFISQIKIDIEKIDKEIARQEKSLSSVKKETKQKVAAPPKVLVSITVLDASIRQKARNESLDELRLFRSQKVHYEETIYRLRNDSQTFKVEDLIARAQKSIANLSQSVEEIESKLRQIDEGEYDSILLQEVNANMELEFKKRAAAKEKKAKNAPPPRPVFKHRKYAPPAAPSQGQVARSPREPFCGISYYELNKELGRYYSDFEKFPQKLQDRLNKMPSNRGFIWRGSHWYGSLPEQEPADTTIVTERINTEGNNFEIHEHVSTPADFTIYRNVTEYTRGRKRTKREVIYSHKK